MLIVFTCLAGDALIAQDAPNPVQQEDEITVFLNGGALGKRPLGVTTNAQLNLIATANELSNSLSVISGDSHQIISSFDIGVDSTVTQVAENVETGLVYVALAGSTDIEVLDSAKGLAVDVIKLDHIPNKITVNKETNTVFVSDKDGGRVTVIDGETNLKTEAIRIAGAPTVMAPNEQLDFLYVGNAKNNILSVINMGSFIPLENKIKLIDEVVTTFSPSDIAINGPMARYYVSESFENGTVIIVDGNNRVIGNIQLVDTIVNPDTSLFIKGMDVNHFRNRLYVVAEGAPNDTFFVIDGEDNSIIEKILLENDSHELRVNLGNNFVYVTNKKDSTLSVINGIRNRRVFDIGEDFDGLKIGINDRSNKVYVTSANNVGVRVFSGATNFMIDTIRLNVGNSEVGVDEISNLVYFSIDGFVNIVDGLTNDVTAEPVDVRTPLIKGVNNDVTNGTIDVNSNTHTVYVGTYNEVEKLGKIKVVDGRSNSLITEIDVGGPPVSFKVNPVTNRLYVANESEIIVIDGNTNRILTRVRPDGIPNIVAINSLNNKIYVGSGRRISIVDGNTNRIVNETRTYRVVSKIAVNEKENRLYITWVGESNIDVDIRNGTTLFSSESIRTESGDETLDVAYLPNTNLIYITYNVSPKMDIVQDNSALELAEAELEIFIEPNPAPKDELVNTWRFRITINELDGLDVQIQEFTIGAFGSERKENRNKFARWFDDCGRQKRGKKGVIPGFGTVCGDIVFTINGGLEIFQGFNPKFEWRFKGRDENLNKVEISDVVEFILEEPAGGLLPGQRKGDVKDEDVMTFSFD